MSLVTKIRLALMLVAALPAVVGAQTASLQDLAGSLARQPDDTVIYTAREFITMDPSKPRAEAIAVRDGKFLAVGTRAEVGAAAGKDARLDKTFNDKVVIAGFVEQHVHPILAALTMNTKVISIEDWDAIDGFSPAVRDEKGYLERLKAALAAHEDKTKPFVTWGYHHYFHGEMSRDMLSKLAPDFPVIVWHRSAHELFLNDAALKLTGIDEAVVKSLPKSAQEQLSLAKGHFYEQGAIAILGRLAPVILENVAELADEFSGREKIRPGEEGIEKGLDQCVPVPGEPALRRGRFPFDTEMIPELHETAEIDGRAHVAGEAGEETQGPAGQRRQWHRQPRN